MTAWNGPTCAASRISLSSIGSSPVQGAAFGAGYDLARGQLMHSVDNFGYRFNIRTLSLDSSQNGGASKVVAPREAAIPTISFSAPSLCFGRRNQQLDLRNFQVLQVSYSAYCAKRFRIRTMNYKRMRRTASGRRFLAVPPYSNERHRGLPAVAQSCHRWLVLRVLPGEHRGRIHAALLSLRATFLGKTPF
jgi:hypothetical protein